MKKLLLGIGALLMCVACSNEEESMQAVPQGNAVSVELKLAASSDASTRAENYAVATEAERIVKTLDAYVFAPGAEQEQAYVLEKKFTRLITADWTPKTTDESTDVTLDGLSQTAKKIFFVANGSAIASLAGATEGTTEADFRKLLMNEMTANPNPADQPLAMTAETSLDAWPANSITATAPEAVLQRVVARIDLGVKAQEGITFTPSKVEFVSARAKSYVFPNDGAYADADSPKEIALSTAEGQLATAETAEGVTLYKSLLFPYEAPAAEGVKLVVTGTLTVGDKEPVMASFDIPFADATGNLSVERNTCYTVTITKINGLDAEADIAFTVSDWNDASSEFTLEAGVDLKMTAATTENATTFDAEVVYPEVDLLKSTATVTVPASEEALTYYLWVGSANIEAEVTNTDLPADWTLTPPTATRTGYLWEKGYWVLTIQPNTGTTTKEMTVTVTNKLNGKAKVSITFTQQGKEEEVYHTKNPLAKWAENNSINYLQSQYGSTQSWWTFKYAYSSQDYPESTWEKGVGSYYQWGRNAGSPFPTQYNPDYVNTGGIAWTNVTSNLPTISRAGKTANQNLFMINGAGNDYVSDGTMTESWTDRTKKLYSDNGSASYDNPRPWPCPEGYRLPTVNEFLEIIPSKDNQTKTFKTLTELRKLENGVKYAIQWTYSDDAPTISNSYGWNEHVTIKCLVVPSSYVETDLTSIDWEDSNVVTRIFYTGGQRIGGYYGSHSNPQSPAPVTFDWDNTAYYWTSESSDKTAGTAWAMTFRTSKRTDDETGYYGPWFQIAAYPKDNALLVRGVKIETE